MLKFKIGDICKIREWNDLQQQYGDPISIPSENYGTIYFGKRMRHLCGKQFTVKCVDYGAIYSSEEGIEMCGRDFRFVIVQEMLELANEGRDENDAVPHTDEEIIHFLTDTINGVLN